jgi:3-keto-5-aminohexanoate cleavage enzyme
VINELAQGAIRSAGGVGGFQLPIKATVIVAGGGVKLGIEDDIWYDEQKTSLASNGDSVRRILVIGEAMGFKPFSQRETTKLPGV